jgi:hypothetical protein
MDKSEKNALLKAFYNAIPPQDVTRINSEEDWKRYVPGLHDNSGFNPIDELAAAIGLADGASNYLFCGHRGTGKSIELKNLVRHLNASSDVIALYVDIVDYVDPSSELGVGDLLLAVIVGLTVSVQDQMKIKLSAESFRTRVKDFFQSEVEFEASAEVRVLALTLGAKLKQNQSFKQLVQAATAKNVNGLIASANAYAAEAVAKIRTEKQKAQAKVVLVVDSLEQMYGDEKIFRSLDQTFYTNAHRLKLAILSLVFSVPAYLPFVTPGIGALYSSLACLPQLKVRTRDGQTNADGIARMRRIVDQRFPDWPKIIDATHLEKLIAASGGNVRILIQLLRTLATKLARESLPLARIEPIDSTIDDVRNQYRLSRQEINWLKEVKRDKSSSLTKDSSEREALARLFDAHLILDYRNGELWYDTLPLIDELLDRA